MTPFLKLLDNRFLSRGLCWALAAVFIYAGGVKLGSPQAFSDSIASFAILPNWLINPLAVVLPVFEIVAGLAVISGIQRRAALLAIVALTAVFTLAFASAIARGIQVDCGCFGPASSSKPWIALARDVLLLAVGVVLYLISNRRPAPGKA